VKIDKPISDSGCKCSNEPDNMKDNPSIIDRIVKSTGNDKEKVIPILQEVQKEFGYIPSGAIKYLCQVTEITPGQISGVSTFFSQFRHVPSGKHTIKVCTGTACHVKGSGLVSDAFRRVLKLGVDESTTADRMFSIEEVACLGCCTLAPVVQIDEKTYGHVKPVQVEDIIDDFLKQKNRPAIKENESATTDIQAEVRVGIGSCCVAGGSREILAEIFETRDRYNLNIGVKPVGCVGVCNQTPLMEIITNGGSSHRYTNVRKREVQDILLKHIKPGSFKKKFKYGINDFLDSLLSDEKIHGQVITPDNIREKYLDNFLSNQVHIATKDGGSLSPVSIDEYCRAGGFEAFRTCLKQPSGKEIIEAIKTSGLRGRGGAGFPTGLKWKIFSEANGTEKYIICNGDEGDPGAFMDRMILESFPFRVIEGMIIAALATGAFYGIFYIRAEYPLAVKRVKSAIQECYSRNILGKNILSTGFSFEAEVFEGAGAFVCGEETALIASIEGRRGTPDIRPPYPAESGLRGKPTLVNNVETLSLVPWIITNGAEAFNSIGTEKSKGTKVFALAGKVLRGGLIEVPMGITIKQIVENIGGGVAPGRKFKAVQIGGPSGGCIPASESDIPVDYERLSAMGAMMGSGGMVVLDDSDCMVDMARYFLTFTHNQSCGKCTFCRIGTKLMLDILTKLTRGEANLKDLDELEKMAVSVRNGSICGLGKTSVNPVLTGLRYFRQEYEEHTRGICRAGKCRDLVKYVINDDCNGCTKCFQECPVEAIPFAPYERHEINQDLCTKCDNCRLICPEKAIVIVNIKE
jgi:NADH:ubiquinone oxidoreductase subunit F (NADH-binding)/NADH:ubiquinone oxidoreductase subunit E